jgi:hypothetical protein
MGEGPDHSIYDVYIGQTLWESFDGYAASAGEREIAIALDGDGPHLLEIRNRHEQNRQSTGYKVRFKQLVVVDREYDLHTIQYQYDAISRLLSADYHAGLNTGVTAFRTYAYEHDLAGNRTKETINGTPTTYSYNAANQITNTGFTYDDNGNLTNEGLYDGATDPVCATGHDHHLILELSVAHAYSPSRNTGLASPIVHLGRNRVRDKISRRY